MRVSIDAPTLASALAAAVVQRGTMPITEHVMLIGEYAAELGELKEAA